jgi:PAS domain S-box-containing protein
MRTKFQLPTNREIETRETLKGREALARLAAIVESSDDAILAMDLEGNITDWNVGAERLYGYTADEAIGRPITFLLQDDQLEAEADLLARIRRGERIAHYETVRRAKDGRLIDVSLTLSPICDATGNLIGISKIARDITEKRRAIETMRDLNESLERRVTERTRALQNTLAELESFSYSVSHDLRAPLRAMSGFAQILLEQFAPEVSPDARRYLQKISEDAARMDTLIDNLLAFSQVTSQSLNVVIVDPVTLVNVAIADLETEYRQRRVNFKIDSLPPCQADPSLLRQVYSNLLSNALKFTRKREVAEIELGYQREHGSDVVVYFVRDNGVGFDMQFACKLFGVFERLHSHKEYEGSGIGLSLVRRIIQRHGGRVWAEAAPDKGATIYFTLQS